MSRKDTVLVFGTFDVLHLGHISFLRQAKKYGHKLIVAIASDKAVKKFKGIKPIFSAAERGALLKELRLVDETLAGPAAKWKMALTKVRPSVICLGYDQTAYVLTLKKYIAAHRLPIAVRRLAALNEAKFKTSRIARPRRT